MGHYYTAEVCLNGHYTTNRVEDSPELRSRYCPKCGSNTITKCSHCDTNIRGDYYVRGVIALGFEWIPASFCHNCGRPYPWTETGLKAAQELADEQDQLTETEREQLKKSISQLVKDTPQTELAIFRYKKLVGKISKTAAATLNNIIATIATETVKKLLGL